MAGDTDHHKEPTQRKSSDSRGHSGEGARSHAAGHTSARPHNRPQGQQSSHQSLSDQLLAAAQQQSGQQPQVGGASSSRPHGASSHMHSTSHQSLSDQLIDAAREQQASQQAHHYASARPAGQQDVFAQSGGAQSGLRPNLLLPLVLIIVFLVAIGGFGGSCIFGGGDSDGSGQFGGFGTSGGNSAGAPGVNGTYTISNNLGAGSANDTWTVLMYVCGSNLESESTRKGGGLATSNLVELTQANLGSNVNYVIETGGAKRWQNNVVSPRYLERYVMEGGYMTQKDRVPSASMAEPTTLADFLSWGTANYPADHYLLVFWDHGGGSITGVNNDDLYPYSRGGKVDTLTLPELRDALKSSGVTFDVIGFDTCLMATLETAETLSPYAKYMVASEESEPGTGWDYTAWPTWLAQHPGTSGADLGTVICQTYYNKCANVRAASTATLSTIDLSKVKAVSQAFENASDDIALATVDSSSLRKLYQGAGKSESYGNDGMFSPSFNMVDLGDLMSKTRDVVGADADAVVSAVNDAVVFETHGRNRGQASGLSVFYPLQTNDRNDFYRYAEISSNTPYLQFLGVMYGVYDNYDWTQFDNYVSLRGEPVNERDMSIAFVQSVDSNGHVQLQITKGLDQVAQVEFEMFISLEELNTLCFIGSDNDLHGSLETGQFIDNFQNDWLAINGNFVSATLAEQGNGYNLYYVPINLNGERAGLLLQYDYSTNEFSVLCAWGANDTETGMAGLAGYNLQNGDEIQFLFPSQNTQTGEQSYIPLGKMTWSGEPDIYYQDLGDGVFAFRYSITDVLGNEQKTDLVYERFQNGTYVR